jgi:hypothetical protein
MNNKINANKLGLTLGIFLAILHIVWIILVALGVGKVILDWCLPLHFVGAMFSVASFSLWIALLLIIVSFISGYVCGFILAYIWNLLQKK